jgi:hypothetical protein
MRACKEDDRCFTFDPGAELEVGPHATWRLQDGFIACPISPELDGYDLPRLQGVADRSVQVEGHDRVFAVVDEDLEGENAGKTPVAYPMRFERVRFLRFKLAPGMVASLWGGGGLSVGVDHERYRHPVAAVPQAMRAALMADLA